MAGEENGLVCDPNCFADIYHYEFTVIIIYHEPLQYLNLKEVAYICEERRVVSLSGEGKRDSMSSIFKCYYLL